MFQFIDQQVLVNQELQRCLAQLEVETVEAQHLAQSYQKLSERTQYPLLSSKFDPLPQK